jgi:hypothetical protein
MREKKVNYVDNRKFYETIIEYRKRVEESVQKGLEPPRLPEYIGECIWKIANKLSNKPCFINYSYKDEMISDGIENCIMYFKDFDPNKTQNPFAYFTQIIYYAFLRRISKEEKNRYIIYKNFQESIVNQGKDAVLMDSENNTVVPTQMYDNINEFMSKFEKKEEIKKQKRKEQKQGLTKFYEEEKDESRSSVSS